MKEKNVYIIAGPNGAGKTTFATAFLPDYAKCSHFVNADLIAQGLAPFSPQTASLKAGKLVLKQIDEFIEKGTTFGFETTLAGKSYLNLFKQLKKSGYRLHLFFLWIPTTRLAVSRIKGRVAEGGHQVPTQDVIRRFTRSIAHFFKLYRPLVNSWILFNNAGIKPLPIAKSNNGEIEIINEVLFKKVRSQAGVEK